MGTEDKDIDVLQPEDGGMAGGAAETAEAAGDDRSVSKESEISETSGATVVAPAAVAKPRSVVDSALDIAKERAEVAGQIVDETAGIDDRIRMWRDWMDEHKLETKEQREKREKRERSKRLMGAIGDGLRALGNLYFTTQYAPDMYNHEKDSQARKADSAIEKARKDREAQQEQYMKFALAIGDAQREKARTIRGIEDAAEKRKQARDKAARDARLFPLKKSKTEADAATAGYKRDIAKTNADAQPELLEKKGEALDALTNQRNASAWKSRNGGSGGGSRGGGSRQYFDVEDKDGNIVRVSMTDLNDFYEQSDADIKKRHQQNDSYGRPRTPSVNEMKQTVTEHIRTKGNTYRRRPTGNGGGTMPGVSSSGGSNKMPGVK